MANIWVKPPAIIRKLLSKELIWRMPVQEQPAVYITFDDGPHPTATTYALKVLAAYNAQATFFCIGKNVVLYPDIYKSVVAAGHTVGNHTHNHLNGWKTNDNAYLNNIQTAAQYISSHAFRPPYGRIKRRQIKALKDKYQIYMWDILSADFDKRITPQQCLYNVMNNIRPGSIIVFHDSEKAWERMQYALPKVLEYCQNNNWQMLGLPKN